LEKIRTFIVDDELHSRELLAYFIMQDRDFDVIGYYADAAKVPEDVGRYKPAVVFTDIAMPLMGGIEMAQRIRALYPEVTIVFVTAHARYQQLADDVDHSGFLLKPVDIGELKECMKRIKSELMIRKEVL
jgi:two-component system, response regulator YesN